MYLKNVGPFIAYTQVHTQFTKESLSEIVKEFKGVGGAIPVNAEELEDTKNYITRGYPREFETISQIAGKLGELVSYSLPRDYFNSFIPSIEAVTAEGVMKAAKDHIHPDRLLVIIMGDAQKIEPGIHELNLGEIHRLDAEGNPVER